MGGKYDRPVIGAFVKFFNKDRSFVAQAVHHEFVVHDFMAHKHRCAPFFQRHFDDLDCAINTGTKPTRGGQIQSKRRFVSHSLQLGNFDQRVQSTGARNEQRRLVGNKAALIIFMLTH